MVEEAKRAATRALLRYVEYPIAALLAILALSAVPAAVGALDYRAVVPVLLVIGAIVVIFVGAWFDFGAREHVAEVIAAKLPFSQVDLDFLYKRQLTVTLAYIGVGGLYIAIALLVNSIP